MRFLKKSMKFVIIIACALSIVNSSSGISQLSSNREVEMKVVDSKNAFISLPEVIEVDVTVLKKTINYYKLSTVFDVEKKDNIENKIAIVQIQDQTETIEHLENFTLKEIKNQEVIKEIVETEEITEIDNIADNLIIKNNMIDDIKLIGINFDNSILDFEFTESNIEVGREIDIYINYIGKLIDDLNTEEVHSKATLYFEWDGGNSTIYKDVVINYTIETEIIEENIDENNQ